MNTTDLRADFLAGATVALVGVPQCLAYALMSGLPPAYGLATAVVPGLVAAIAGRSPFVITGPTNTTGLLVLAALVPVLAPNGLIAPSGLGWLATLTLMCGVLRIMFALGGGAVVIRFIPESVLGGFTVGVGVLIAVMQVDEALGLPPLTAESVSQQYDRVIALFAAGTRPSSVAAVVTLGSVVALVVGQRAWRRVPVALIVVCAAGLIAWALQLDGAAGLPLVRDRITVAGGWPPGAFPDLRPAVVGSLLVPASAIVLLGTLELLVSIRADGSRPDVPREIVAQGAANIAGAFWAAFPASASITRSALLRLTRPHTRAAAAFAAVITLPILWYGSNLVGFIPQATLAAVLFTTALTMVTQPTLSRVWRASSVSRLLLGVTAISTLLLPLEWAVFVGAGLGLLIHVVKTSSPRVRALAFRDSRLVPVATGEQPDAVVLEVSGAVHYAAVDSLLEEGERALPSSASLVILDLSHAHELRFTGVRALEWWAKELEGRGVTLRLAGVTPDIRDLLERAHSHLAYEAWDPEPGRSAWNSYRRARSIE